MSSLARSSSRLPVWLLLSGILLVALNLRPVITAVGPVLPVIGDELGLGSAALGVLAAVPIVAFAVVSPVVHPLARRFGVERTVLVSLVVLALGTLLRSAPGPATNLWIGTALVGATVAVGNVLLPVVVKKDFPLRVPATTAWYVATQSVFAAIASGVAVPLAAVGGWELALGVWAAPVALALAVWVPRLRAARVRTSAPVAAHHSGSTDGPATAGPAATPGGAATGDRTEPVAAGDAPRRRRGSVYRHRLAWLVAAYMGLQSTVFYSLLNWLPSVEQDLGVDPVTAGWHLFAFQAVAIVGNLAVPSLMRVGGDQRLAATVVPGLVLVAMVGVWLAPGLLWVWIVLIGLGTGSAFVVALSLVGLRAADPATASQLSAMSQALGYGLAAAGLVLAGVLRGVTGPGATVLLLVGVVAVVQLLVGLRVGRSRTLHV
ncbi:MFS transporter [Georgenia daeguensis]|uniref:MFS transporter n=1 Tax=Georgenia daeguensis TaxID=908355 RepID=A0ABP6UJZ8_9MICO